ncbi:MAG: prolipoprotein diacylglyceryl transferase [Lentisphaerae bacterium RIFOXYB12_FULL_65_16]|nr:MAG: prolipoprotein diacylglyceryl transferase [Lentisphaerae bacterium RIFOXYA12_64_32]OGV87088.1 MAG: prolipoprotein diacylglyceryl transferase [Lentisphaerae bacterium RIFOXYB12_FULL_65_16]
MLKAEVETKKRRGLWDLDFRFHPSAVRFGLSWGHSDQTGSAMDPVAFHLGSLTIRWYGVFVALGFLAGFLLAQARAGKLGLDSNVAADIVLAAMVGGILGARLLYVAQSWSEYRGQPLEIIRIDHGGLVFNGGVIGAMVALYGLCRIRSLSPRVVGDLLAPALPLGHALGRVGCYLNGCCFGHPYSGAGAVHYPAEGSVLYVQAQQHLVAAGATECLPVFPIQLVSAAVNLALCAILLYLGTRIKSRGLLFPLYLILFAVTRFCIEFGRGDYLDRVGPLTPAQAVCLVLLPAGITWFVVAWRSAGARTDAHAN